MIHVKRDMREVRVDKFRSVWGLPNCQQALLRSVRDVSSRQPRRRGRLDTADGYHQKDAAHPRDRELVQRRQELVLFASIASIPLRRDSTNLNPNFRLADTT